jgi:hypothetical protein
MESGHPYTLDGLDVTAGTLYESHNKKIMEMTNASFIGNFFIPYELQSTGLHSYKAVNIKKGVTCAAPRCSKKGSSACTHLMCSKCCVKLSVEATEEWPVSTCT